MKTLAIINPNTSEETTDMMTGIARDFLPHDSGWEVEGITATSGPSMITDELALKESSVQVVQSLMGLRARSNGPPDAVIIGAIGDPGLAEVRRLSNIPAFGLAESAMLEAAQDGRSFGIVTTTPGLVSAMEARVAELGLLEQYTGIRLTNGDPQDLVANPHMLSASLSECVERCFKDDHAEAVIIGGGPLSEAAKNLQPLYQYPIIVPVESALQQVLRLSGPTRRTASNINR